MCTLDISELWVYNISVILNKEMIDMSAAYRFLYNPTFKITNEVMLKD